MLNSAVGYYFALSQPVFACVSAGRAIHLDTHR